MLIIVQISYPYLDAIDEYDGGTRQVLGSKGTAGIFATYPKEFVSNMTGFWDQVFWLSKFNQTA